MIPCNSRLDAPIVLAHGLFGFPRIGLGRLTLARYFRGIPEALEAAGNRVLTPRVPAIAGIVDRAGALAAQIEAAFPGQLVHIIGHSMGGLDARMLLSDPAWSCRVLSVTTIATPHRGSALADCARLRLGFLYPMLGCVRLRYDGFLDVTRRAARALGRRNTAPRGVACFSVAGDPPAGGVHWSLEPLHDRLARIEGPNDGLVSVDSGLAFGRPLPSWPLDHVRQLGWFTDATASADFYGQIVKNLAEAGFGETSTSAFTSNRPDYPSARSGLDVCLDGCGGV